MVQAARNIRENVENVEKSAFRYQWKSIAGLAFLLVVLLTLVVGGWKVMAWMQDPQRLPLSKVVVIGERHFTTDNDIRQAILSFGKPGTVMTVNVNAIQQKLEQLPWIKQVSLRKKWPNELKIYLVEYVPIAYWNKEDLLNDEGRIFRLSPQKIAHLHLPFLQGPEGSAQEVLQTYQKMAQQLTTLQLTVESAVMSDRHAWDITLSNGVRLALGQQDCLQRLQRFIQIYPVLLQQGKALHKQINYIDLRYDSGAAVGWKKQ